MPSEGKSLLQLLASTAVVRAVGAVAQLLMTIVIARSMGSQAAGQVFFAYALVMLVSQVSLLGSEISGLRAVAINAADQDGVALRNNSAARVRFVLASSSIAGLSTIALVGLIGIRGKDELSLLQLSMAAATIPLYALVLLLAELFKGIGKPALGLTFQNVLIPIIVIGAVSGEYARFGSMPSSHVIAAIMTACAITAIAILAFYSSDVGLRTRSFCLGRTTELLKDAPRVAPVSATPAIIQWSGVILLGILASPEDVATYAVAARVTVAVGILHSAVASVAAPRLAIAFNSADLSAFRTVSVHTGLLISALALPVLGLLFFFSQPILEVFGSSYAENGSTLLRILVLGQIVAAIFGHAGTVLLMAGRFRIASTNSVFSGVLQLSMTLALVPALGAVGAALATALTVSLGHITTLVLVRAYVGLWPIPLSTRELRLGLRIKAL